MPEIQQGGKNLTVYRCPMDGHLPLVDFENETAVCVVFSCPLSYLRVSLLQCNKRGPHENRVKHIEPTEPIFVLRAQDKFSVDAILHWQVLASDVTNPEHDAKVISAGQEVQAMADWQRENPDLFKHPD